MKRVATLKFRKKMYITSLATAFQTFLFSIFFWIYISLFPIILEVLKLFLFFSDPLLSYEFSSQSRFKLNK